MSSLIVDVCEVEEKKPHPNADRVEIIRVKGWEVVSQIGQFNVGDKAVYFPPDTVITEELAEKFGITNYVSELPKNPDGTRPPGRRIRAKRFRGEQSFGFITKPDDPSWEVGLSVVDHYGATKYEPIVRDGDGNQAPDLPAFHRYTDIENLKNFPNAFQDGEEVVITEKIHGCLSSQMKVRMADGTSKKIIDIKEGDIVFGMNEDGSVVATPVLKTFNNGNGDRWLRVECTRTNSGRGPSYASLTCTPNHRFWSPRDNQYVSAEDLKVGDELLLLRQDVDLTPIQKQVILGKLLGDGYLAQLDSSASVHFSHKDESLIEWTEIALGSLATKYRDTQTSGYGTRMVRTRTNNLWHIKDQFSDLYKDGKRTVPKWVETSLTPLSLAFWYMDDGSLSHNEGQEDRALFACCDYTKEDCDVLISGFSRLGINATYYVSEEKHSRLRLNSDDAERLFLMIAPYIPPDLQYKLPERYRGHAGWLPTHSNEYKPRLVKQIVTEITEVPIESHKYDIETATHNFFAGGLLVHNSNSRMGYVWSDEEQSRIYVAGSRTTRKKSPEDGKTASLYWNPLTENVKEMLLNVSIDNGDAGVILFEEIYGAKVQDLAYGLTTQNFRAFDISVNGVYLDYDILDGLLKAYEIDQVPVLYRGPYSKEIVAQYTDGPTTLCDPDKAGKFKGREGIVIRPVKERYKNERHLNGRMIFKSISIDYLERKNGTEFQ